MSGYIKCPITFMRGPCDEGYHVPSLSELQSLYSILLDFGFISIGTSAEYTVNNFSNIEQCLLAPSQGDLLHSNGNYETRANLIRWFSCTSASDSQAYSTYIGSSSAYLNKYTSFTTLKAFALAIRPFKDTVVIPDNNWTVLYQGTGSAGFYHNSALGLISASSDGTNWITFADKNLGATNVYTSGATLSEANCGKLYQWGNNYGFTWGVNASPKIGNQVDASKKGPGNYYSSSVFIYRSTTPYSWDVSNNANLRGGSKDLKNAYIGVVWAPGSNTVCYYPFDNDTLDATGNTTISGTLTKDGLGYRPTSEGIISYPTGNYPLFLNYWLMVKSRPTANTSSPYLDNPSCGYYLYHTNSGLNKHIYTFYTSSFSKSTVSFTPNLNTRHNISVGYDGTKMIYSIDGVSGTLYNGRGYNFNNKIVWQGNSGQYVISNLIAENTVWTEQEIQDYYNKTKANYGL